MTSSLTLNLFGGISLWHNGAALTTHKSRKGLALFLYLACTGRAHTREALADLLWDATSTSQSLSNLRTVLTRLPTSLRQLIAISRGSVAIARSAVAVDVWALEETATGFAPPLTMETVVPIARVLHDYQGKFLADFRLEDAPRFEEWATLTRERYHQLAWQGFEQVTTFYLSAGLYQHGVTLAAQWLALEPFDEVMHIRLLRLLHAQGQLAAAEQHYRTFCQLLQAEYQLAPGAELQEWYNALSKGSQNQETPTVVTPQLPFFPTPLIGREQELTQLQYQLNNHNVRLLTITGIGGVGKTRLAVAVAEAMVNQFGIACAFVPLADVNAHPTQGATDPIIVDPIIVDPVIMDPIIVAICNVLQLKLNPQRPAFDQLIGALQQDKLLLVLDNFEHLIADVGQITTLLAAAPKLTLLVTSRERLQLREEWTFPLDGLAVPAQNTPTPADIANSAISLFVARARQQNLDFDLAVDPQAITRICQLVEGLPLAIEMAAAWVALLPPAAILAELEESFDLLTSSARNVPQRHQTMRAIFDTSWQSLDEEVRTAFTDLAIFCDGFTREAAQAVAGVSLRTLQALVNKSLLRLNQRYDRYEMLVPLRQYALEKLMADEDRRRRLATRHSYHFCLWLQRQEVAIKGATTAYELQKIDCEQENLAAAWWWAIAQQEVELLQKTVKVFCIYHLVRGRDLAGYALVERSLATLRAPTTTNDEPLTPYEHLVVRLTIAMVRFALRMGRLQQANTVIQTALAHIAAQQHDASMVPLHAEALLLYGHILYATDLAGAYDAYCAAETLFQSINDDWNRANTLMALGATAQDLGKLTAAGDYYERGVALRRRLEGPRALGEALLRLADHRQEQLLLDDANALVTEAIAIFQRLDDAHWQAHGYGQLGLLALYRCAYAESVQQCDRAIDLLTQLNREHETIHWLFHAATAHLCQDHDSQMVHYLTRCRQVAQQFDDRVWAALCTFLMGCRLLGKGHYTAALTTFESAERALGKRTEASYVWAMAAYAHWHLGNYSAARDGVVVALHAAMDNRSIRTLALVLPAAALLVLTKHGESTRAARIYRVAERLPYIGNSPYFMRMAGERLLAGDPGRTDVTLHLSEPAPADPWLLAHELQRELAQGS